jgi:hypothetical protein
MGHTYYLAVKLVCMYCTKVWRRGGPGVRSKYDCSNQGYSYPIQGRFERADNPTKVVGLSSLFFRRKFSLLKIGHLASISLFSEQGKSYNVGCLVKFSGNCRIYMVS